MIAVSTLLKSCATPPASWPMACIFCAWAKLSCSVRCSVVSSAKMLAAVLAVPLSSAETKNRADRSPAPFEARVDGRDVALARRPRRHAPPAGPPGRARHAGSRSVRAARCPRRRSPNSCAKAALERVITPRASTDAMAIGVELKKRAKRTSAARRSSAGSSPGARLITRVRDEPGTPSCEKATRCSRRTGRLWPLRRLRSMSNCSVFTSPAHPPRRSAWRRRRPR